MALPALMLLLPALAAIPACALLGGAETAALAALAAVGLAVGVQLHQMVAEHSLPRAG